MAIAIHKPKLRRYLCNLIGCNHKAEGPMELIDKDFYIRLVCNRCRKRSEIFYKSGMRINE